MHFTSTAGSASIMAELERLLAEPGISYPASEEPMEDLSKSDGRAAEAEIDSRIFAGLVTF